MNSITMHNISRLASKGLIASLFLHMLCSQVVNVALIGKDPMQSEPAPLPERVLWPQSQPEHPVRGVKPQASKLKLPSCPGDLCKLSKSRAESGHSKRRKGCLRTTNHKQPPGFPKQAAAEATANPILCFASPSSL